MHGGCRSNDHDRPIVHVVEIGQRSITRVDRCAKTDEGGRPKLICIKIRFYHPITFRIQNSIIISNVRLKRAIHPKYHTKDILNQTTWVRNKSSRAFANASLAHCQYSMSVGFFFSLATLVLNVSDYRGGKIGRKPMSTRAPQGPTITTSPQIPRPNNVGIPWDSHLRWAQH